MLNFNLGGGWAKGQRFLKLERAAVMEGDPSVVESKLHPWMDCYLTSLTLVFLIYRMGIVIPIFQREEALTKIVH